MENINTLLIVALILVIAYVAYGAFRIWSAAQKAKIKPEQRGMIMILILLLATKIFYLIACYFLINGSETHSPNLFWALVYMAVASLACCFAQTQISVKATGKIGKEPQAFSWAIIKNAIPELFPILGMAMIVLLCN